MQDNRHFHCECGFDIPVNDEDGNFPDYCPSCGREVVVPQESHEPARPGSEQAVAPIAAQTRSVEIPTESAGPDVAGASVFTARSVSKLEQREVASVNCLCGATIPITLAEVSDVVYCPSCGSAVPTSYQLERHLGRTAGAETEPPNVLTPIPRRTGILHSLRGVVAMLVVVALLVWIVNVSLRSGSPEGVALDGKALADADGEQHDFDPEALTSEAIRELKSDPDAFHALALAAGWMESLQRLESNRYAARRTELESVANDILESKADKMRAAIGKLTKAKNPADALETAEQWSRVLRFFDVPENDPRIVALAHAVDDLRWKSNPITLERIQALRKRPLKDALMQAGLWQRRLADRGVPDSDPRTAALRRLVDALLEKSVPAPTVSASDPVTEFLTLLAESSALLDKRDLPQAEKKLQEAEKRLGTDTQTLGKYRQHLLALRQRLARERTRVADIDSISGILDESRRAAESDSPMRALELLTRARFGAARMTLPLADAQQLRERVRSLDRNVRLARGRRAVTSALGCHADGATAARNHEVRQAYRLLAGLPVDTVRPLLERVSRWKDEALADTAQTPKYAKGSQAWLVNVRNRYESALTMLAEGKQSEFLQQALTLQELLASSGKTPASMLKNLNDFVLDVLELQLDQASELPANDAQPLVASIEQTLRKLKGRADDERLRALEARIRNVR